MAQQLANLRVSNRRINSTNMPLEVAVLDGSGGQVTSFGTGGTQYTEGDIDATITGTAQMLEGASDTLQPAQGSTITAPAAGTVGLVVRLPAPLTDSTNNALRVFQVASSGGSTETTVRQSTYTGLNGLMRLADRDASTNVANITNTAPASTAYGLAVREVAQSTGPFAISSLAGRALVDQNSTTWNTQARVFTSSGGGVEGSTSTPSTGTVVGLHVREVMPSGRQSTTLVVTSSNSTAVYALISSVASVSHRVYAYFVGSTTTVPSTLLFMSSLAIDRWPVMFGSGSSGVTGANLAVTPPGFIFETVAGNALNCRVESGSTGQITRIGLSWFSEA